MENTRYFRIQYIRELINKKIILIYPVHFPDEIYKDLWVQRPSRDIIRKYALKIFK